MGLAETFKALSDPVRREILMLLRKGKMSAGEIAAHFEMTGATVSPFAAEKSRPDFGGAQKKLHLLPAEHQRL